VAGASYGLATRGDGASPVLGGLVFGLGFHAVAYEMLGPALGVTPAPWRDSGANQLQHAALHAVFGVVTAVVTDRLARPASR
jgi:hypothetical protein